MEVRSLLQIYLSLFVYLVINVDNSFEISCKDENNKDVDWFINYKLPKIEDEQSGSNLQSGKAYAFITSKKASKWKLSSTSVESKNSMLGRTWQEIKNEVNKNGDTAYLFYNDDPPHGNNGSAVGHLKGYIAFDSRSGVWMIHSIPRLGDIDDYNYPSNGLLNGQIAMCVTFDTSVFSEVCNHLLYCHPNIYTQKITPALEEVLDKSAKSLFTEKPAFIRKPELRESTVASLGGQRFLTFAKDNQMKIDLYSDVLAPKLQTDLVANTWRRGAGGNLEPFCESDHSVVDIISINMTVSYRKKRIFFTTKEDHSKWAISVDRSSSWVCIADLNRMESQARRGGGAVCFRSKSTWEAFRTSIADTDTCSNSI